MSVTQQSGSMNRYSYEQFTQRLLPGLRLVSSVQIGQPLCLMSPIGQKALLVELELHHTLHIHRCPPTPLIFDELILVVNIGATFTKTAHLPCSSLASSASAYGSSLFLLDNPNVLLHSLPIYSSGSGTSSLQPKPTCQSL